MVFQKELKQLGLKDKEAAVYLACLELGPSPVQQISRKSKVVRATTYVVLESLAKRGLVTQYKEGKKTLFAAEPPRQLLRLIEKKEEELAERKTDIERVLPELQVLMKSGEGRPTVRYFDGVEGLRAMRQEMVMYTPTGEIWRSFTPIDHLDAIFSSDEVKYAKQRKAKKIVSKSLFTTRSDRAQAELLNSSVTDLAERRFVDPDLFNFASGFTIFMDRIAIGSFTGKIGGVIIESKEMVGMLTSLFDLAWLGAEKLDK